MTLEIPELTIGTASIIGHVGPIVLLNTRTAHMFAGSALGYCIDAPSVMPSGSVARNREPGPDGVVQPWVQSMHTRADCPVA